MEPISFVAPTTTTADGSGAASVTGLADNFDTFLQLLTSQLRNQDPLSPTDASEFTNQLVQFSQVEQQIGTNTRLSTLIDSGRSGAAATLAAYLGRNIEIMRDVAGYSGEPLSFVYTLPEGATSVGAVIEDSNGNPVWASQLEGEAGRHELAWDGRGTDGTEVAHGAYRLVIRAENAAGETLPVRIGIVSRVVGLDLSSPEAALVTAVGVYGYADAARVSEAATS